MHTPDQINRMPPADFVAEFGGVFEHSPWVAERAAAARPFADLDALHRAMTAAVARAPREQQLALLRAHPELAGREAQAGALTDASRSEQSSLGLTALSKDETATMTRLNAEYRAKFGFPCIIAVRLHKTKEALFAAMTDRVANDPDTELAMALGQVAAITRFRLEKLVASAGTGA